MSDAKAKPPFVAPETQSFPDANPSTAGRLAQREIPFVADISDEIRTPLTLLLGPVEELLARRDEPLSTDVTGQLEMVHRNGLRLLRLVNTLLDFWRIDSGQVRAAFQPTDLAALIEEQAALFRAAIERAGLKLSLDCEPLPEPAYVDREMWEKIILNLLSNALKFTQQGEIVVSLRQSGNEALIRVKDTGIGIPAENLPKLFERGSGGEQAQGRTQEGAGFGLALVKKLVELHGGSITAESMPGEGTRFTIRLPLGKAHLRPEQVSDRSSSEDTSVPAKAYVEEALGWLPAGSIVGADPPPHLHHEGRSKTGPEDRPRVLIADDNADMRRFIARILAPHYDVILVADGKEALASILERPPDLFISDTLMPGINGMELLGLLRGEAELKHIPIILLSARSGEESRIEGIETGADDYLTKPFSGKELLARVAAHLRMARLRQEAIQALQASEERFRTVVETTPECVKIVAADGTLLYINPAGLSMIEFPSPESVVGKQVIDLIAPEYRDRWNEYHHRICAGQRLNWEFEIIGRHGSRRMMDTHAVPLRMADDTLAQLAITRDITQRRQFENQERARSTTLTEANERLTSELEARNAGELAQARLAAIVESSDDAIVSKNLDGVITSWNRSAQKLFGYKPDEAVGQNIMLIVPPERHDEERRILARLRKGQKIDHFETQRLTKDGRRIDISISVSPIRDGTGKVVGASKIARDITERKRIEQEREALLEAERNARGAAQRINALKDEFLATLSHELRTPLSAIMGWAQLLSSGKMEASEFIEAGQVIERNARTQKQLIDDLLDMSRIISGKLRLDLRRIAPIEFVEAAIETVQPTADTKKIRIEKMLDPTAGPIAGDPARLQQVVWNLLTNAVKFTPKGGKIQVLLERVDSHLELTIADTGEGIDPEFLPHLFERFRQADATTTRRHGGLGLGLSIVKQITELHGGTVSAHSNGLGTGSTFVIRLPLLIVHSADAQQERVHPRSSLTGAEPQLVDLSNLKILVIDDEPDARELIRRLLVECGAIVQAVESAAAAMVALAVETPDVVVSDIGMPEVDGYELLRQIRKSKNTARIPAIALTAFARSEDRTRAMRAGYIAHVAKPVEPAELLATIAVVTGRPSAM